jgi:hypothetical protein
MNTVALIICFGISLLSVGIISFSQGIKQGEENIVNILVELGIIEFDDLDYHNKKDDETK